MWRSLGKQVCQLEHAVHSLNILESFLMCISCLRSLSDQINTQLFIFSLHQMELLENQVVVVGTLDGRR